ncbi:fumarylacetoacetate hydrolase family protein [Jiangella aurantiaca]|uniref:Fumarylacetoacetate hydrolase family protein n=1 Tax=Jiangella aurantiaca TaxID=2530373 RepID=A0A4R5ACC9_9ACTN|nr:fumarylacetoacetate hydrolase family protein [Jiangella aurantiaca]TDD68454.1 fumarylacetoacetate hydrolase family protein [Jiangella aurantiaca]
MRFATIDIDGHEQAAVACHDNQWAPLDRLDPALSGDLLVLIEQQRGADELKELADRAEALPDDRLIPAVDAVYRAPYRRPYKVWGIGLNYGDHAADLHEETPEQPASFIKGHHTIIGPGDDIVIPRQSARTTAEAELGLVIGRTTTEVSRADAIDHVFGVCAVLDQTAEDILALNPRYLTRSKNFPTFFSFGPEIVTMDEFLDGRELSDVEISTYVDGRPVRRNVVANMTHRPAELISFHSQMMPFFPGDLISTGTPGAGVIQPGVVAEARVDGLLPLLNPVRAQNSGRS